MSFTNPCSQSLTAIVIVHIFYINETITLPTSPPTPLQKKNSGMGAARKAGLALDRGRGVRKGVGGAMGSL